jgi:hypothetical protein
MIGDWLQIDQFHLPGLVNDGAAATAAATDGASQIDDLS